MPPPGHFSIAPMSGCSSATAFPEASSTYETSLASSFTQYQIFTIQIQHAIFQYSI